MAIRLVVVRVAATQIAVIPNAVDLNVALQTVVLPSAVTQNAVIQIGVLILVLVVAVIQVLIPVRVARSVGFREESHAVAPKLAPVVRYVAARAYSQEHSPYFPVVSRVFPIHLVAPVAARGLDPDLAVAEAQAALQHRWVEFLRWWQVW